MKQTVLKKPSEILHRIEVIEKEVLDLKLSVLKSMAPSAKKMVSLKGIIKGVDISEKDIEQAKKSLYSRIEI